MSRTSDQDQAEGVPDPLRALQPALAAAGAPVGLLHGLLVRPPAAAFLPRRAVSGGGGIRTHETAYDGLTAFKAAAFNRSATPPGETLLEAVARSTDWMQGMRRLLILASAMIFFDVAFFAAIAPLLPEYVDELGLSKAEAGILSAAYAAGTLLGSLPAGFVASRVGPRRTVIAGLLLLGCRQPRLRLRQGDLAARRHPLRPGDRRAL